MAVNEFDVFYKEKLIELDLYEINRNGRTFLMKQKGHPYPMPYIISEVFEKPHITNNGVMGEYHICVPDNIILIKPLLTNIETKTKTKPNITIDHYHFLHLPSVA